MNKLPLFRDVSHKFLLRVLIVVKADVRIEEHGVNVTHASHSLKQIHDVIRPLEKHLRILTVLIHALGGKVKHWGLEGVFIDFEGAAHGFAESLFFLADAFVFAWESEIGRWCVERTWRRGQQLICVTGAAGGESREETWVYHVRRGSGVFHGVEDEVAVFVYGGDHIEDVGRDGNILATEVEYEVIHGDEGLILLLRRDFLDIRVAALGNIEGRAQVRTNGGLVVDKGHGVVEGGKGKFVQLVRKQQDEPQ